jgi:hypothetical protein
MVLKIKQSAYKSPVAMSDTPVFSINAEEDMLILLNALNYHIMGYESALLNTFDQDITKIYIKILNRSKAMSNALKEKINRIELVKET